MTFTAAHAPDTRAKPKIPPAQRFAAFYHRNPRLFYLACFALPFLLMFLIYSAMEVWPLGRSSVLVLDLNGQYVYFFEALRDWIYGEGSLLYSFSRQLGGEFLGIYAYYLASPLSYLIALFPKANLLEALYLILLIKVGLCGMTFALFLSHSTDCRRITVLIFSTTYALTSYMIVMQHNTMWIDCVYFLPLIALGIRQIQQKGSFLLFALTFPVALLSNFYIGFMMCFFVLLYFFYTYFSTAPAQRGRPGERHVFLRSLLQVGFFSVTSLLIASLLLIPAYYSLQFGKTGFSTAVWSFTSKFDLLDLFSKFLFGSYDTVRPEGLPVVYCGTLTLILLPFFFLSKRVRMREKICSALLILLFIFSFSIQSLDLIWHGFQAPNWLNYRYSFMLGFVLLVCAAKAFDDLRDTITPSLLALVGGGLVLLVILVDAFHYEYVERWMVPAMSLICLAVWLGMLYQFLRCRDLSFRYLSAFVAVLTCVELFLSGLINMISLDSDVVISSRSSYLTYMDRWQPAIDTVKKQDPGFYRMEKLNYRTVNDSYALGYRGLSGSTSTLNADTIRFLDWMGVYARSHWSQYSTSTPLADALLGVRYVFDLKEEERVSALYTPIYEDDEVAGYRNEQALSVLFASDGAIADLTFLAPQGDEPTAKIYCADPSPFVRLNTMTAALLGEDGECPIYEAAKPIVTRKNTTTAFTTTHYYYYSTGAGPATITYTITGAGEARELYAFFPSDYPREVTLYINGEKVGPYLTGSCYGYINLGKIGEGNIVTLTLELGEEGTYIRKNCNYFYYLNEDAYTEAMEALNSGNCTLFSYTEDSFKGSVTIRPEQELLMTTIPYDEGWKLKAVNDATGERLTPEAMEVLDGLLAYALPAGNWHFTLTYMPDCYPIALGLSLTGTVLLMGAIAFTGLRKRRRNTACSAEVTNE